MYSGGQEDPGSVIGLAEYKAPVYSMYPRRDGVSHSVPRCYLAQMHGQMAVCDLPWCDFVAVCDSTRDVTLQRVHFSSVYWDAISRPLAHFCDIVQVHLRIGSSLSSRLCALNNCPNY